MRHLIDRRTILKASALSATAAVVAGCSSETSSAQLEQPGPLKEMTLGSADAPIKVIEYASMTCPHCASFHNRTYHALKEKYIDTGKVLFSFREFPLDPVAATVAVLARCSPEDKFFNVVDVFFKTQPAWRGNPNPLEGIGSIAKQLGFTDQSFKECLKNQEIIDGVNAIRKHGIELKVDATPTFFVNGKKISGAVSLEVFEKEFERFL